MTLVGFVVAFVFGWPAVFVSAALTLAGILMRSPKLALAGALAALPFMFFVFGLLVRPIAPVVACAHFGCAYAVKREKPRLAGALFAPFVALAVGLAALVVRQWTAPG